MNIQVLKITDQDDQYEDPMYYTIKGLRNQVLNEWYDEWNNEDDPHEQTKEEIETDDEKLFDFMDDRNYSIEFILTITENDL